MQHDKREEGGSMLCQKRGGRREEAQITRRVRYVRRKTGASCCRCVLYAVVWVWCLLETQLPSPCLFMYVEATCLRAQRCVSNAVVSRASKLGKNALDVGRHVPDREIATP